MNTINLLFTPEIHCDATLAGEADTPTRFEGVAYSGGLIPQFGSFGDAAIDLSTAQPADALFMLINHDPNQRAGHGRVWIDGDQLRVSGQFARSTEAGRQLAAEFKDGAPWQLSVGMQGRTVKPATPATINGQSLAVKTLFTHAAIREVSFVPVGADPHTSVVAFAAPDPALPDSPGDVMSAELEAKIADLQSQLATALAELAAEKTAHETAEAALNAVRQEQQTTALKALLAAMSKEYSDEAALPYRDIPLPALTALTAEWQARVPTLDPALTRPLAVAGQAEPDLAQLSAKLFNQVSGKGK
jgi:hypothetical protein